MNISYAKRSQCPVCKRGNKIAFLHSNSSARWPCTQSSHTEVITRFCYKCCASVVRALEVVNRRSFWASLSVTIITIWCSRKRRRRRRNLIITTSSQSGVGVLQKITGTSASKTRRKPVCEKENKHAHHTFLYLDDFPCLFPNVLTLTSIYTVSPMHALSLRL